VRNEANKTFVISTTLLDGEANPVPEIKQQRVPSRDGESHLSLAGFKCGVKLDRRGGVKVAA
jgi:hypothetical protein